MCKEASIAYDSFFTIFDMIRVGFVGLANGDHNLSGNTSEAAAKIEILGSAMGAKRILAPLPRFVINASTIDQATPLKYGSKILRNFKNPADVGLANDLTTAITFCNADCPIGVLVNVKTGEWAMLHLGLKNLIGTDNLIRYTAGPLSHGHPENLYFWCGAGIGPCCYGISDKVTLSKVRKICPQAVDINPPSLGRRSGSLSKWRGFKSINLHLLIESLAEKEGFGEIQFDYVCTCCAKDEYGRPRFFSNVAQGGKSSQRNCCIALRIY